LFKIGAGFVEVTLSLERETRVIGSRLRPGDRVTVYEQSNLVATQALAPMCNLRQIFNEPDSSRPFVTLAVDDDTAQKMVFLADNGTLSLSA
jgi:hypothetical protein